MAAHSAVFEANDELNDLVDINPGDGLCVTSNGSCTLRAAIQESNALDGADTILLGAKTYRLSIPGRNENASSTGDLDITDDLIIEGLGARNTFIDGGRIDRVFEIKSEESNEILSVSIKNVSITRGEVLIWAETPNPFDPTLEPTADWEAGGLGGGISVINTVLDLEDVWIYQNVAMGLGGGISALRSKVNIKHSSIFNNESSVGAGIASSGEEMNISDSLIFNNPHSQIDTISSITFLGGGIFNFGNLTIDRTLLYNNTAEVDGGALYHGFGILRVRNSTLTKNSAKRNGGAVYYRTGGFTGSSAPVIVNSAIIDNGAYSIDKSDDFFGMSIPYLPVYSEFFSFNNQVSPNLPENLPFPIPTEETIDFSVPVGDGEDGIGAFGGGGIFVSGRFDSGGPAMTTFPIANSVVADNNVDCVVTSKAEINSYGGNVDSDATCNFINTNKDQEDLPTPASMAELKLVPLSFTGSLPAAQSDYNKLIPPTQLIEADSPLRNAANHLYCVSDDQRKQKRPEPQFQTVNENEEELIPSSVCDIGAYEFLPPIAYSMQYVAEVGNVSSSFIISDPAEKTVTYEIVTQPSKGSIAPNGSYPAWSYTANNNVSGSDQFTYRACFSNDECSNEATIGITLTADTPVNETVTIELVSEVSATTSQIDIVDEENLIAELEDTNYAFPVGAIFFSVKDIPIDLPDSDSLVVELQLPLDTEIPADAVVRKLDNDGVWQTLSSAPSPTMSSGVIDPINKTITLTLLDNDVFDSNATIGEIRDPVALAIPESADNLNKGSIDESSESKSAGANNLLILVLFPMIAFIRKKRLLLK